MSIDEQEKPESTPDGELVNEQADAAADQMPADEQVPSTEAPAVDSDAEPVVEGIVVEEEAVEVVTADETLAVDDAVSGEVVADEAETASVAPEQGEDAAAEVSTGELSDATHEVSSDDPADIEAHADADAEPEGSRAEDEAAGEAEREPVEPAEPAEPASEDLASPRLPTEQLQAIVEALIFASPEPLSLKTLSKLLAEEPAEDVAAAVQAVKTRYEAPGGLHLVEVAGGFQITTRPDCHEWVRRLFHERTTQKLSVQALETLAVTAYRQPITAAEIGEIRGVNTSGVLSTLLERHLIKIVGRKNVVGRPFLYGTTREFLIRFGLKDLSDLPRVEDMAQALGFDAPAILRERSVTDEMLPLDEEQAE